MKSNNDTPSTTAEFLLQIKAIKLDTEHPFTWSSGLKSPIYCDNRKTLAYPKIRTYLRQEMVKLISDEFGPIDVIAGVASGAIALGALIAQELGLPFCYVRSAPKQHGLTNVIEGVVEKGQSVVVVEDLVSTGKSSIGAAIALRDAGCTVKGMVAIFTYQMDEAISNFKNANLLLHTLTDYNALIAKALESGYIAEAELQSLIRWRENPSAWGT